MYDLNENIENENTEAENTEVEDIEVKNIEVEMLKLKTKKQLIRVLSFSFAAMFTIFGTLLLLLRYSNITFFSNLREIYIETAMTTMSHQYLATSIFTDSEIEKVMKNSLAYKQKQIITDTLPPISSYIPPSAITSEQRGSNNAFILPKTSLWSEISEDEVEQIGSSKTSNKDIDRSKIEIIELSGNSFKGKLITINDPSRVKLSLSSKFGKIGERLGEIVKREGAVGGINASGFVDYDGIGLGDTPTGIVIKDGKVIFDPKTPTNCIIGFNKRDQFIIGNYRNDYLINLDIRDAVEFSPFLIINGEKQIKVGETGGAGIQPRTAIGQTIDGKVLMLVIDGRQLHSLGATLKQVQDILFEHGAYNAASVDGGSSSSMWYNGKIQNSPCGPSGERLLPTAFVIK